MIHAAEGDADMAKVVVAGGGAAGMMAAVRAAERGHEVTLLEQNEKLGKKVYITGKGRCNLTNGCDTEDIFSQFQSNPRFLYSSIYTFDNYRVMDFFKEHGLRLKEERGGRIFPVSDHASDVIRTLSQYLKQLGVEVCLQTKLVSVKTKDGRVTEAEAIAYPGKEKKTWPVDALILAGGGCSYPQTGSDGNLFALCQKLGHTVTPLRPALVPFNTKEDYIPQMMGLSLKNVTLTIFDGKKRLYEEFGEMLFTHFGVSGPLVLSASSMVRECTPQNPLTAEIDLKPALDQEKLDRRLQRMISEGANKQFKNLLSGLLPAKMLPVVITLSGIDPEKKGNAITKEERAGLLKLLKAFPFTITGTRGFAEAIITKGGISVKEVDPSTMESKIIQGIYFAGEMLDIDALTGGFNLQAAWSTGYLAGECV